MAQKKTLHSSKKSKPSVKNSKPQKKTSNSNTNATKTPQKPKNPQQKISNKRKSHHQLVEQDDLDLDEIDSEFIKDNANSLNFLKNIDPVALTEKIVKPVIKKPKVQRSASTVQAPQNLSDSEDESNSTFLSDYIKKSLEHENKNSATAKKSKASKSYDIEHVSDDESAESNVDSGVDSINEDDQFFSDDDGNSNDLQFDSENESDSNLSDASLNADSEIDDLSESEIESQSKEYSYVNRIEKKKIKRLKEASEVMDYELDSRKFDSSNTQSQTTSLRLPTKDRTGKIIHAAEEHPSESENSDNEPESSDSRDSVQGSDNSDDSSDPDSDNSDSDSDTNSYSDKHKRQNLKEFNFADKPKVPINQYLLLCQMQIAEFSESIIQNPEENVVNIKHLIKYLQSSFHKSVDANSQFKVKQLALVSLLAIFCDIIPGYRIRELTKQELETKVSKEVKLQRKYEENLVKYYRIFLTILFKIVDQVISVTSKSPETAVTLFMSEGILAVKALVQLLNTHTHFNFRTDIMEKLVSVYIQSPENIVKTAAMANESRNGIITLLKNDLVGRYSDEATLLASKHIKRLSYKVDPSSLRPWLFMPLCDELVKNPDDMKNEETQQARKEAHKRHLKLQKRLRQGRNVGSQDVKRSVHLSKKQRKIQKELKEANKDLQVAEAEVDMEERKNFQSSTLKHIFITYFRILKHKQSPGLYPAVLEGLARFAHLISVDFFPDLLASLKRIVRGEDQAINPNSKTNADENDSDSNFTSQFTSSSVSPRSVLLCIITAVHMLTAQKDFASLDLVEFFNYLYSLIPILACRVEIEDSALYSENSPLDYINKELQSQSNSNGENKSAEFGTWEASMKTESKLFIDCLHMLFLKKITKVPLARVCAFAKRLSIACNYFPTKTAVSCLKFLELLIVKYPDMANLFKNSNTIGGGLYLPYIDEADMSNANSTCLFEMHKLLVRFYLH
ncbi:Nucleolar complex-associated protein 3 [Smittium culicis]|uniref:Nucleolar complex-associated protein 3 n=1 Tax=Smittium culicis TaxID=133412 RepID=A0A1R1YB00_9FUNG|nr:Nucleolar complex-associated protein 3 [Smittium culicis]